jgi:hypothetical protein
MNSTAISRGGEYLVGVIEDGYAVSGLRVLMDFTGGY